MNQIFILVGPSGVGKSTVQAAILQDMGGRLVRALTTTTRPPRPSEVEGKDFYFVSKENFEAMVQKGDFVEWVETFGRRYGTTRAELDAKLAQGHVLMITDMRGAHHIREQYPNTSIIFLDAAREDLVRRIQERPGTTPEDLERRLKRVDEEKASASEADITLFNPDGELATTIENVKRAISQRLDDSVH